MKDIELECLPAWRFCRIPYGTKGPNYRDWQKTPYTLDQIPSGMNIGVILGQASGGLCAIDFDGPAAWDWWDANIGIAIPATVAWASGRQGRCQMAFSVPPEAWEFLSTKKINLNVPCPEDARKMQGFELRWSDHRGVQSVLPPSLHPDTQQEYFWIHPPSQTDVLELPWEVLQAWIRLLNPDVPTVVPTTYVPTTVDGDDVVAIYEELRRLYGRLERDMWLKATWAACRALGRSDGLAVMKTIWPEEEPGEYEKLLNSSREPPARPVQIGTIVTLIRELNPEFRRQQQFNAEAPTRSAIQKLRKKLKEMY